MKWIIKGASDLLYGVFTITIITIIIIVIVIIMSVKI